MESSIALARKACERLQAHTVYLWLTWLACLSSILAVEVVVVWLVGLPGTASIAIKSTRDLICTIAFLLWGDDDDDDHAVKSVSVVNVIVVPFPLHPLLPLQNQNTAAHTVEGEIKFPFRNIFTKRKEAVWE